METVSPTQKVESFQDLDRAATLLIAKRLPQYFSEKDVMKQLEKVCLEFDGDQDDQMNFVKEFVVKNGKLLAGKFFISSPSESESLRDIHRRMHGESVTICNVIAGIAKSLQERVLHF